MSKKKKHEDDVHPKASAEREEQVPAAQGEAQRAQADQEVSALRRELDEVTSANTALEDKLKRALADIANIRRRIGEDMRRAEGEAIIRLARELLPIMDSFRLALSSEGDRDGLLQGLKMVRTMLEDLLSRHGVERIDPTMEDTFDPSLHEALAVEEREDMDPGKVVAVHQEGFRLGERILRPARVVVSKQPSSEGPDDDRGGDASKDRDSSDKAEGKEETDGSIG